MPDNCGIVHSWCNHRVKEHPRLLVGCAPCAFRDSRDGECEFGALFRGMLYMLCEAELPIEGDPQVLCFLRWLDCCARYRDVRRWRSSAPCKVCEDVLRRLKACPMFFPPFFRFYQHSFQFSCVMYIRFSLHSICNVIYETKAQPSDSRHFQQVRIVNKYRIGEIGDPCGTPASIVILSVSV